MDLLKYASKLKKMSSDEIISRVRQKARNSYEQVQCKLKGNGDAAGLFVPSYIDRWQISEFPFPSPQTAFFGLNDDADSIRSRFQEIFAAQLQQVVDQAEARLAHQFTFLGLPVTLPDPIEWNCNPQTGKRYPLDHHSRVDTFNTEKYGDVKYVWELNRHQFFIEVAKAYFLTGDERYAEKIWSWLESWIADTPHKFGINNTSVLEHVVRIYSWVWSYYFTRDSAVWTDERKEILARQLLLQGEMIEENLSYYFSPYNHLIGEIAALAFLGTVYDHTPKLKRWRDKYWLEMESQIRKQFHPDGFTVEQASYYHHFTVGFYLMGALLRRQNNLPVADDVWQMLEKTLDAALYLTRPDGELPRFGDIDSARSIYFYYPEPMWNLRPFQAIGALLFNRGDMKFLAGAPAEELLWLFGGEGIEKYQNLEPAPPAQNSRALYQSGYYIMRDGWNRNSSYCCFDCGEIAHGVFKDDTPSAAHGHGDILSFELSIEGQPLVVDPGFYTYFGPEDWHRYLRSSRGHNTIEINGRGQARHEGRIAWSQVSSPEPLHWMSTRQFDFAGGAIDRFAEAPEGLQNAWHRRFILFRKGLYLLVMDEVGGAAADADLQVESSLHFVPGELTIEENRLSFNRRSVALISAPENSVYSIRSGGEQVDQGWAAEGYGMRCPAPVFRIAAAPREVFRSAMLFPLSAINEAELHLESETTADGITRYHIRGSKIQETIYLNPAQKTYLTPSQPAMETDALCMVEQALPDKEKEFHFIKLRHLSCSDPALDSSFIGPDTAGVRVYFRDQKLAPREIWKYE